MSRPIDADKLIEQIKKTYCERCDNYNGMRCKACPNDDEIGDIDSAPTIDAVSEWIPCSERLPSEEERREWIDTNLDGIGYLYPCLVTRYSSINPDRTKNNPYVAKHYFDGEDFVDCGEQVCSEYILAWMPLPKPYGERKGE